MGEASSLSARLKPTTFEGAKESNAIASQGIASTNIRLSNNLEIEVCNTLTQNALTFFSLTFNDIFIHEL